MAESKPQLKTLTLKITPQLKDWLDRHSKPKNMTSSELVVAMLEMARSRKP